MKSGKTLALTHTRCKERNFKNPTRLMPVASIDRGQSILGRHADAGTKQGLDAVEFDCFARLSLLRRNNRWDGEGCGWRPVSRRICAGAELEDQDKCHCAIRPPRALPNSRPSR